MFAVGDELPTGNGAARTSLRRLQVRPETRASSSTPRSLAAETSFIDPTVITPDCRYVCFTDQPLQSEIWEIVPVPSSDNPRRTSRYYKMKPHRLFDI